jgi:hypothetical protein
MKTIIATSGFCLPQNPYYTPYEKDNVISDQIFNRSAMKSSEYTLLEYFKDNEIYTSTAVNKLYADYKATPSFDNQLLMIDLASEILKPLRFSEFVSLQLHNPYISTTSLMFCSDLLLGRVTEISSYGNIPYNARFTLNKGLTSEKIRVNVNQLIQRNQKKLSTSVYAQSELRAEWVSVFSDLMKRPGAFILFYKYVLADYY